eukprot:gnl/MRDRNA2_/MRDRNA2_123076_c0_seq1.p1 gnl/MRDRNA2_/MRDRNA2_123076_c0~~gnl/MRDRNA2_/MRDRNA2_123076_c0_seq1.p1  ORF type:complete len:351 (+),score=68.82 gnl/MRDRNA2_/MRDRNA2_123076_c0_seq1:88-1140(+)
MVLGETTPKGGFGSPFTLLGGPGCGDPLAEAMRSCPGPPQYNYVPESRESFGRRLKDLYGPWPGHRAESASPAPCASPVSGTNESTADLREVVAMLADKAVSSQSLGSEVATVDSEAVTVDSVISVDASEACEDQCPVIRDHIWGDDTVDTRNLIRQAASDAGKPPAVPTIKDNIWGDETVDTRNLIRQAVGDAGKPPVVSTPGKACIRSSQGSPSKFSGQHWPTSRSPKRSASHLDKENESPLVRQRIGSTAGVGMRLPPTKSPGIPALPRGPPLPCVERSDMVPRQDLEDVAYERDFYFAKLRRIEALCDMYQEKPSLFAGVGLMAPVVEALYCSEDTAEVPRYPVGC